MNLNFRNLKFGTAGQSQPASVPNPAPASQQSPATTPQPAFQGLQAKAQTPGDTFKSSSGPRFGGCCN